MGYYDRRQGKPGIYVSAAPGINDPLLTSPRLLTTAIYGEFNKNGKYFYQVMTTGELKRISIPSGKEEIIKGTFPGLTLWNSWFDISYDGKEIVYTDARVDNKLIIIENLFK